jgi:hypothetical protein
MFFLDSPFEIIYTHMEVRRKENDIIGRRVGIIRFEICFRQGRIRYMYHLGCRIGSTAIVCNQGDGVISRE